MDRSMTLRLLIIAGLTLAVSACGGFREQLGLTKQSPDEFRVVSRAPLTLPPDYNLRPPEPGAPRPQVGSSAQQAERAVFANSQNPAVQQQVAVPRTAGEQALLEAAGASRANPDIRLIVNRETKQLNEESDYFVDRLVFWNNQVPAGTIVDPVAETRRLQENAALGQPPTTGPTPQIERRRKAPLEGLF
jgi:hypothetical protein